MHDDWFESYISISCTDSEAAVGNCCCRIIEMFTMFSMQTLSKFSHCFVFVSMLVEYLNFSVIFLQSSK
jgi:hypothetical protein